MLEEYVGYGPENRMILATRLRGKTFTAIVLEGQGRYSVEEAGLVHGNHNHDEADWLRFFDAEGNVVPTGAAKPHADAEKAPADEIARLKAQLQNPA